MKKKTSANEKVFTLRKEHRNRYVYIILNHQPLLFLLLKYVIYILTRSTNNIITLTSNSIMAFFILSTSKIIRIISCTPFGSFEVELARSSFLTSSSSCKIRQQESSVHFITTNLCRGITFTKKYLTVHSCT